MISAIEIEKIPGRNMKYLEINNDIDEFLSSGATAAEVKFPPDRKPSTVCASYKNAVSKNRYMVKVIQRNNRVFLIRGDIDA